MQVKKKIMIIKKDNTIEEFRKGQVLYKDRTDLPRSYHTYLPVWVLSVLLDYTGSDKDFKLYADDVFSKGKNPQIYLYDTDEYETYILSGKELDGFKLLNKLTLIKYSNGFNVRITIPKYKIDKGIIGSGVRDFDIIFFNKLEYKGIIFIHLVKRYNT